MKKIVLLLSLLVFFFAPNVAADDDLALTAKGAIAVDANTGKILYEKEADKSMPVGSITKLLTAYLVYEAVAEGKLSWQTPIEISDYPYQLTFEKEIANVPLDNRKYTVKELLEVSLVYNANSPAIALAEAVAGNESKFVDQMKAKLSSWGVKNAKIVNASGVKNSYLGDHIYSGSSKDDENELSAYAVAVIANRLIKDYPEVLKITQKTSINFEGNDLTSYNYMLEGMSRFRAGVDGLHTGNTEQGESLVTTSNERGMRLMTIILNTDNPDHDIYARFTEMNRLMTYINQHFVATTLVKKGESYGKKDATIIDGATDTVRPVAKDDLVIVERIGTQDVTPIHFHTKKEGYLAPIKKNQTLGSLTFTDKQLVGHGYLQSRMPEVDMVAEKGIKKAIAPKLWWNHFVNYVNEKL